MEKLLLEEIMRLFEEVQQLRADVDLILAALAEMNK